MKSVEIRIAGEGGQGVILACVILAEAAAVFDGYTVVQTQTYGPESRGGASKAELIISKQEIDHPLVLSPDLLLLMSQEAADKHARDLGPKAVLVIDSTKVSRIPKTKAKVVTLPITRIAQEQTGRTIAANIVGLGVLIGVTGIVSPEAVAGAIKERVPKGTEDLNIRAFNAGLEIGRKTALTG